MAPQPVGAEMSPHPQTSSSIPVTQLSGGTGTDGTCRGADNLELETDPPTPQPQPLSPDTPYNSSKKAKKGCLREDSAD